MIYLCCDTNIWINISNGLEPPRLLNRLYDEINSGHISLILPEIVQVEWNRNKTKAIIDSTKKSTKKQIDELKKLEDFLDKNSAFKFNQAVTWGSSKDSLKVDNIVNIREKIRDLVIELKKYKNDIYKEAEINVETVEKIFAHQNTIILKTDPKSTAIVVDLAINKKFPFENEKNNFADCLIFYQFINFLKDKVKTGGHFVTTNRSEFFPNQDLHETYKKEIIVTSSHFYKSLSEALNSTLEQELVSVKELKYMAELAAYSAIEKNWCEHCSNVVHFIEDIEFDDHRHKKDLNQLSLFSDEIKSLLDDEPHIPKSGVCEFCEIEYVTCPDCLEIWKFPHGYRYETIEQCSSCEMAFIYTHNKDKNDELINKQLSVPDLTSMQCSRCGNEYDASNGSVELCQACAIFPEILCE